MNLIASMVLFKYECACMLHVRTSAYDVHNVYIIFMVIHARLLGIRVLTIDAVAQEAQKGRVALFRSHALLPSSS